MTAAAEAMMRGSVSARPLHTAHGERAEALPSSTPPVLAYDYGLVTTRAGFDALESEWNDLFDRAGSGQQMFQTFNWLWHWANHFLPETPGGKLPLHRNSPASRPPGSGLAARKDQGRRRASTALDG